MQKFKVVLTLTSEQWNTLNAALDQTSDPPTIEDWGKREELRRYVMAVTQLEHAGHDLFPDDYEFDK